MLHIFLVDVFATSIDADPEGCRIRRLIFLSSILHCLALAVQKLVLLLVKHPPKTHAIIGSLLGIVDSHLFVFEEAP